MADRVFTSAEFDALRRWLEANQDSRSERMIGELEQAIAADYPALRVLATSSCMGALSIALQTIGIGAGDEVIVDPVVVFGGMAVLYHNGTPVFADVDSGSYNMDPASVRERITSRTKAIVCTHHFGNICEIEELLAIAAEHGIPVVEDCAHALHATRRGKAAGLFGHFAAFSFNHRKQISTGQGGFLLINDPAFVELSLDKAFGRVPATLTWNYAMPGIVAALAIAQWPHARDYVDQDIAGARLYDEAISKCRFLRRQEVPSDNCSSFHIWAATFDGDEHGVNYDLFIDRLKANGGDYFLRSFMPYGAFGLDPSPVYRYPLFNEPRVQTQRTYDAGLCPNAERLVPRMFNTVLSPVEWERIERYADALHRTAAEFA